MGKKKKTVELQEMNILLRIPENMATLEINASVLDGEGKRMKVSRKLSPGDIFKARQDFLENVEDGDEFEAGYVVTEKGFKSLRRMEGMEA